MKIARTLLLGLVFLGGCSRAVAPIPALQPIDPPRESAGPPPRSKNAPRVDESNCRYPLSDLCEPCASYAVRRAELARSKKRYIREGECSSFRFIQWSNGFEGATEFFDADGHLVGARTRKDYATFCLTGAKPDADTDYGDVPAGCGGAVLRRGWATHEDGERHRR